jgi:hypothetical protein
MLKLSVTVPSGGAPVVIQDAFPTEGLLILEVATNSTATVNLSFTQLGRIAAQIQSLLEAGNITFTLTAISGNQTWIQESDLAGLPDIYSASESITIGGETGTVLYGYNLVAGQVCAHADLFVTGAAANTGVVVRSILPGQDGNAYTVTAVDTTSGGLSAVLTGSDLVVDFGGAAHTATLVAAAINGSVTASPVFIATAGGSGAGNVAVQAETQLAGGTGSGLSVSCCGIACTVTALDISASPIDKLTITTPDLGTLAANNGYAKIKLRSGEKTSDITVVTTSA